jgi:hypothetical protein
VPEDAIAEDRAIVVKADPGSVVTDQLEEAVLLEGEDDELVERISEHRPDRGENRQDEEIRDAPAERTLP